MRLKLIVIIYCSSYFILSPTVGGATVYSVVSFHCISDAFVGLDPLLINQALIPLNSILNKQALGHAIA